MKKQGLWFLTLFSLILVLSVYYITMPNELFKTNNSKSTSQSHRSKRNDVGTKIFQKEVKRWIKNAFK